MPQKHLRIIFGFLILLVILTPFNVLSKDAPNRTNITDIILKGITLHDQSKYEEAIKTFLQAFRKEPDNGYLLYEMATTYYALKEFDQAIDYAIKANKNLTDSYKTHILAGNIYDHLKDPVNAEIHYKEAILISPQSHMAYFNMGIAYYNNKKYRKAEQAMTQSIERKSNHASCYYALGYIHLKLGEPEKAKKTFRKFLIMEKKGKRYTAVKNLLKKHLNDALVNNNMAMKRLIYND